MRKSFALKSVFKSKNLHFSAILLALLLSLLACSSINEPLVEPSIASPNAGTALLPTIALTLSSGSTISEPDTSAGLVHTNFCP